MFKMTKRFFTCVFRIKPEDLSDNFFLKIRTKAVAESDSYVTIEKDIIRIVPVRKKTSYFLPNGIFDSRPTVIIYNNNDKLVISYTINDSIAGFAELIFGAFLFVAVTSTLTFFNPVDFFVWLILPLFICVIMRIVFFVQSKRRLNRLLN